MWPQPLPAHELRAHGREDQLQIEGFAALPELLDHHQPLDLVDRETCPLRMQKPTMLILAAGRRYDRVQLGDGFHVLKNLLDGYTL